MRVLMLIQEIEEMIEEAATSPFSNKIKIDKKELEELIHSVKDEIPGSVKESEDIVDRREEIIRDAERQSKELMDRAESHAKEMIDDNRILDEANEKASVILERANKSAIEIRNGAKLYAEDMLAELEEKVITLKEGVMNIESELKENLKELK